MVKKEQCENCGCYISYRTKDITDIKTRNNIKIITCNNCGNKIKINIAY